MAAVQEDAAGDLVVRLHAALRAAGHSVGTAESLTGGELAALLSSPPGASATFVGGVVSYATEVKRRVLGVTSEQVISGECAEQMATGARHLLASDWALAATGVAGPDLQEEQPPGTVFVGVAGPHGSFSRGYRLAGDRAGIRTATCVVAVELLLGEVGRG